MNDFLKFMYSVAPLLDRYIAARQKHEDGGKVFIPISAAFYEMQETQRAIIHSRVGSLQTRDVRYLIRLINMTAPGSAWDRRLGVLINMARVYGHQEDDSLVREMASARISIDMSKHHRDTQWRQILLTESLASWVMHRNGLFMINNMTAPLLKIDDTSIMRTTDLVVVGMKVEKDEDYWAAIARICAVFPAVKRLVITCQ